MSSSHQHRPGPFNRPKKPFKSKHATKGQIKKSNRGRVGLALNAGSNALAGKLERRNRAKQVQKNKHKAFMAKNRLGHVNQGPPKFIAMVALSSQIDLDCSMSFLLQHIGFSKDQIAFCTENSGPVVVSVPKVKSRFCIYKLSCHSLESMMNIIKACDFVLFFMSMDEPIDSRGRSILSALLAQGLPSSMGVLIGLNKLSPKDQIKQKKDAVKKFREYLNDKAKVFALDTAADADKLIYHLSTQIVRPHWHDNLSYMLPDSVNWVPYDQSNFDQGAEDGFGTLELTGYIRGRDFDCNSLAHLVGMGDYQVLRAELVDDPFAYHKDGAIVYDGQMKLLESFRKQSHDRRIIEPNPELQEDLIEENEVDDSLLKNEEKKFPEHVLKQRFLVPRGTDPYQARWLARKKVNVSEYDEYEGATEEEEECESECDIDEECMSEGETGNECSMDGECVSEEESEELEWVEVEDDRMKNMRAIAADRKDEVKEVNFHLAGEIELPYGQLAQDVLREYRGMKSFRTSTWNPREELPIDYARIFQFSNFKKLHRHILEISSHSDALLTSGSYVKLVLKDCKKPVTDLYTTFVLVNLLPFENKYSVMHYSVVMDPGHCEVIPNETELTYYVGFRKFTGPALLSDDNPRFKNHKMENFLRPRQPCVISVYAPVSFPPLPVLVCKAEQHHLNFIAAGAVKSCDPDRIILKKVVLTGHPISVHKRKAIIRGMFFHPSDVKYFQKADLWTKSNIQGNIVESLGTKGLFKAIFGSPITNSDVVCISLYKRVFPFKATAIQPPRPIGTVTVAPKDMPMETDDQCDEYVF
ncbi:pre-rRNA-processing protein TSR1 homolog [Schistocerca gregaria]|uniref:pre-rRNA-processing protein TSR1 homolog n=1 Tax=Schistocerca gregaria TaxID=7010 RepID=UPI00211F186C|nr:pre-rRNA-processing protein TSR1 homolog [Schistocerca gregaria]